MRQDRAAFQLRSCACSSSERECRSPAPLRLALRVTLVRPWTVSAAGHRESVRDQTVIPLRDCYAMDVRGRGPCGRFRCGDSSSKNTATGAASVVRHLRCDTSKARWRECKVCDSVTRDTVHPSIHTLDCCPETEFNTGMK